LIVLDTNILSELMRLKPEPVVFDWVARQPPASLYTTTITQAEILCGLEKLPGGKRRNELEKQYRAMLAEEFAERVLAFDQAAAEAYGPLMARVQRQGRRVGSHDVQIAAIALSRGASVATRNVSDFENFGIEFIDPWAARH
jgi:predicted nucleic acid-binding protein